MKYDGRLEWREIGDLMRKDVRLSNGNRTRENARMVYNKE